MGEVRAKKMGDGFGEGQRYSRKRKDIRKRIDGKETKRKHITAFGRTRVGVTEGKCEIQKTGMKRKSRSRKCVMVLEGKDGIIGVKRGK